MTSADMTSADMTSTPTPARAARVRFPSHLGTLAVVLGACSVVQFGASDTNLANARSRSEPGAQVFERSCATCHGSRGEGRGAVPPIMGPSALSRYPQESSTVISHDPSSAGPPSQPASDLPPSAESGRPELVTAANLHAYLSHHMPKLNRSELSPEDYWAVVTFMLIAHGSEVPKEGVNAENAARVPIAQ